MFAEERECEETERREEGRRGEDLNNRGAPANEQQVRASVGQGVKGRSELARATQMCDGSSKKCAMIDILRI
jgi:hypothetical protein